MSNTSNTIPRIFIPLSSIVISLLLIIAIVTQPVIEIEDSGLEPKSSVVIAAFPTADTYGQGIDRIYAIVNGYYNKTAYNFNGDWNNTIELSPSDNLTLSVYVWMNSTLTNTTTISEYENVIKLHISVLINNNGTEVFAKQNFTRQPLVSTVNEMVSLHYQVYIDFVPTLGLIYTGTITYEVYY